MLSGRLPDATAILLVESGSREIIERVIGGLRRTWGLEVPIDLVSCFAALPAGFDAGSTRIYRVSDYRGREGRGRLYRLLRANRYALLGMVCSGEPLMTKWKWALALRIPAKVFVINENGDYFWLDRKHFRLIRQFLLERAGLAEAGAARMLAQLIAFPFTLLFLLLFAAWVHARRGFGRGST